MQIGPRQFGAKGMCLHDPHKRMYTYSMCGLPVLKLPMLALGHYVGLDNCQCHVGALSRYMILQIW